MGSTTAREFQRRKMFTFRALMHDERRKLHIMKVSLLRSSELNWLLYWGESLLVTFPLAGINSPPLSRQLDFEKLSFLGVREAERLSSQPDGGLRKSVMQRALLQNVYPIAHNILGCRLEAIVIVSNELFATSRSISSSENTEPWGREQNFSLIVTRHTPQFHRDAEWNFKSENRYLCIITYEIGKRLQDERERATTKLCDSFTRKMPIRAISRARVITYRNHIAIVTLRKLLRSALAPNVCVVLQSKTV